MAAQVPWNTAYGGVVCAPLELGLGTFVQARLEASPCGPPCARSQRWPTLGVRAVVGWEVYGWQCTRPGS